MQSCEPLKCGQEEQTAPIRSFHVEPSLLANDCRRFSLTSTISLTDFIPDREQHIQLESLVCDSPKIVKRDEVSLHPNRMVQAKGDILPTSELSSYFPSYPLLRISRLIDPSLADSERNTIISTERERLLKNALLELKHHRSAMYLNS